MAEREVYHSWGECWRNFKGYNLIGALTIRSSERTMKRMLDSLDLPKDAPILDLGCGAGRTLRKLREWGYQRAIGIDNRPESIELCCQRGFSLNEDIFLMDAIQTSFSDDAFAMVFAEGVLEHFRDFSPFIREMVRLSRKHILILQPNHFSLYGALLNMASHILSSNVKEYSYHPSHFCQAFEAEGCTLQLQCFTPLQEVVALLFRVRCLSETSAQRNSRVMNNE